MYWTNRRGWFTRTELHEGNWKWMRAQVNEWTLSETKREWIKQGDINEWMINEWVTSRAASHSIHEIKWSLIECNWIDAAKGVKRFMKSHSFNSLNERQWIMNGLNEVWVTGFIPFHEVHSAFINYMKWINLAKLNGMRMNDIITVNNDRTWA